MFPKNRICSIVSGEQFFGCNTGLAITVHTFKAIIRQHVNVAFILTVGEACRL